MASAGCGSSGDAFSNGNGLDPELEILMEKIRAKPNQKSWPEIIKNLRMAISDKRHFSEVNDKQLLQKYLDILQKAIKVNGHMSLLEKLSSLARGVGLKYSSRAPYSECFLSTDMFYVEIKVDPTTGRVLDVTVIHDAGDRMHCPEVADIVNEGKFDEFTEHLEGLMSINKINGDKKQKSRCFMALQYLEKDLNLLAQLQSSVNGVSLYIHKTPLGIVQPRIGGLPMKLIFFVAPIDLVKKGKIRVPMTVESIMEKRLGYSCTVGIEPSATHKLQTVPLMSISKNNDGKSLPSFSALSNQNSCSVPASFTLSLIKPLPVSVSTLNRIQLATGLDIPIPETRTPILELIVKDVSNDGLKYKPGMPFFVSLPNQEHCYYITGEDSADHMTGTMVTSVPFVHPTHVPLILQALRQQIAFNTLVSMMVRPNAKTNMDSCMIFEVSLISLMQMSVIFEHPVTDMMASVEFEFSDLNNVRAQFISPGGEEVPLVPDENLCKIVNKTYSIPITMRSLMKRAADILLATQAPTPATPADQALTPIPPHTDLSTLTMDSLLQPDDMAQLPAYTQPFTEQNPGQNDSIYDFDPYSMEAPKKVEVLDSIRAENVAKNPMLASLLDQDSESSEVQPVLPTLLSDPLDPKQKHRKHRKRKAEARSPGSNSGRSPKRKFSEDDHYRSQEGSFDMDSNDGFDLGQQVPFPSGVAVPSSISQSQTGGGNVSNPPVVRRADMESHVSRLKSSLESLVKQEPAKPRGELVALLADDDPPAKVPAIGQATPRRLTSRDEVPSIDKNAYQIPDVPLDPDIFTTDDGTFTPTDFIGSSAKEPRSVGFQPESLDFNPDLLGSDTIPDPMSENTEDMDLDACDDNAFCIAMTKAVTKLAAATNSDIKLEPKTPIKSSPKVSAPISIVTSSGSTSLASQVPAPIPTGPAPSITYSDKKEIKKEKKEDYKSSEYRPIKKSNKPLSARIGEPKPDLDALDFPSLPVKDSKSTSLKSLLKESSKDKKDKEKDDSEEKSEFFTSTSTGGTSIVISAKSSPSTSSKDSLKISVKKDRIKKSSRDEDLKRRKESSFSKEKALKKRRLNDESKSRPESKGGEIKPIKIKTSGGRVEIQAHSSSMKSKETKPDVPKVGGPDYLKHLFPSAKLNKLPRIPRLSEQGKPNLLDKSTINPQGSQKQRKPSTGSTTASITVSKSDSKLMTGKTPTIKLKPLVLPSTASSPQPTNTKPVTSSTKTQPIASPSSKNGASITSPSRMLSSVAPSGMAGTPPIPPREVTPPIGSGTPPHGSNLSNPGKGKSPIKARSLSDVINKLKAKSSGPSSGGEEECDEKDEKKRDEKKSDKEKKTVKDRSSSSNSSSLTTVSKKPSEKSDDSKFKIKSDLKKAFSSPGGKSSSSSSKSSSGSSSSNSSSSKATPPAGEKKTETKKTTSPVSKSSDKLSPSPSVKRDDKKEKGSKEESSAKDPRLEPKTEKPRPSSTDVTRSSANQDSPKIRSSPKLDAKPLPGKVSPVKESPDSPDESLVIDLPLTPSGAGTRTIPMERSSPLVGKSSPIPPSPLTKTQGLVSTSSPLVRTASPLVRTSSPALPQPSPREPTPPAPLSALPVTSPVSNPSPCPIDDDLMDEAVMGCAEK